MSKDVEGIEAAKCTIIALGLYLSGFAVKRPHTNKVISSCYRSFLKKTPELLQQEPTWDRAAFGDVYCSCITSPPQAGKAKKRKYMQALLVLSQKKPNRWFALRSTWASYRTPTAAATTQRCVAGWLQLWENPSSRGWNFLLAQQRKVKKKLQSPLSEYRGNCTYKMHI